MNGKQSMKFRRILYSKSNYKAIVDYIDPKFEKLSTWSSLVEILIEARTYETTRKSTDDLNLLKHKTFY